MASGDRKRGKPGTGKSGGSSGAGGTAPQRPPRERPRKPPAAPATKPGGGEIAAPPGAGPLSRAPRIDLRRIVDELDRQAPAEQGLEVRRPDDLLVLRLVLENLQLAPGPPRLVRHPERADARITIELPPQSFGEEAFLDAATETVAKETSALPGYPPKNAPASREVLRALPSARVRMAGRSRIVFTMPDEVASVPYTLADVLQAFRAWPMRLDVGAVLGPGRAGAAVQGPALDETVGAPAWRRTGASVASALERLGGGEAARAAAEAAGRLGELAAATVGTERPVGDALEQAMANELSQLAARFPALRDGDARAAATAALAIGAAESFAKRGARLPAVRDALLDLPFLPIVLAPHEPSRGVTALELPYRLLLSPLPTARWRHAKEPVLRGGRIELWHTRLTTAPGDAGPDTPTDVRALWSPDYPIQDPIPILNPQPRPSPPLPFRMSLDALDRKMLVQLMAGFDERVRDRRVRGGSRPYAPVASEAKRLHLSALGALLDVEGSWDTRPGGVDLQQWRHLASLGRDHEVRVVYAGYLYPLGHAASLIKVTERQFESLPEQGRVAVLRQRFFVAVRERTKHFSGEGHEFEGRNFPFTDVEILTHVTPALHEPGAGESGFAFTGPGAPSLPARAVFWPMVDPRGGGPPRDFAFEIAATDLVGRRVTSRVPLLFVDEVANARAEWIDRIRSDYDGTVPPSRRSADLANATVCYAPLVGTDKGDPRLPTERITLGAGKITSLSPTAPHFYPEIATARVGVRAVQKLLGRPQATIEVTYPKVFKQFGDGTPGQNAGKVFLQVVNEAHELSFGGGQDQAKSDALGALATPQMTILGLSKIVGPVAAKAPADLTKPEQVEGALTNVIGNTFDPGDFFHGATILGGIPLAEILGVVKALAGDDVPKLLSRELPDRVEASFEWSTEIKTADRANVFIPRADPGKPQTTLAMSGVVTTPLDPSKPADYRATAQLDNFKVNLFGFVIVWFEKLAFAARKGQKPDVSVDLRQGDDAIQFGGPLAFVNALRDLIPSGGFSDPPSLSVTPSGIAAGYSLNLPAVSVGIFALTNASLGATFSLPFDSSPAAVKFHFSEREHPFSLTVSLLGGGGFFAIGVSARGVDEIEAALEFGAAISIDLGVASGGVEIKAGIYFHWLQPQPGGKGSVDLAGYVRLHGELSVLGLISASLTFNLQLAYHEEGGARLVYGEATLVIEVEVLLFSAEVPVRCRKEFAGAQGDPKVIDLVPDQATWDEYCRAFADEAA